ncbi:hypothetical protein HYZ80_02320 [Candidatus Parcubacteria bacterium]|nr:hypothetical protein [Candidatus Parcubacteria bacterium]
MLKRQAVRLANKHWEVRQKLAGQARRNLLLKPATLERIQALERGMRQYLLERFKAEERLGPYVVRIVSANGQEETLEILEPQPPVIR